MKDPTNPTVQEAFLQMREMGAATWRMTFKDKHGTPIACAMFIEGKSECDQMIKEIEKIEDNE